MTVATALDFQQAIDLAVALQEGGMMPTLCHGLHVAHDADDPERRMWRAWVEVKDGGGWWVCDEHVGRRVKRANYYRVNRLDGDRQVWRFSMGQAYWLLGQTQSAGPWVDGWETMT